MLAPKLLEISNLFRNYHVLLFFNSNGGGTRDVFMEERSCFATTLKTMEGLNYFSAADLSEFCNSL